MACWSASSHCHCENTCTRIAGYRRAKQEQAAEPNANLANANLPDLTKGCPTNGGLSILTNAGFTNLAFAGHRSGVPDTSDYRAGGKAIFAHGPNTRLVAICALDFGFLHLPYTNRDWPIWPAAPATPGEANHQ